jgi:hypothetical protein
VTELKGVVSSIEKGVTSKEMRLMARANRQMLAVRRRLKAPTVNAFLKHALPAGSDALARLLPFAAAVCTLNWQRRRSRIFRLINRSFCNGRGTLLRLQLGLCSACFWS